MSLYIFLLYYIYHLCLTCIDFYDLSAWGGCWFVVYIRRFIYKFLNVCPFDYTAVAGSGKVGPVNPVNHTSLVAVVTLTDRPMSVRNRSVIELFCGVVCVVTLPFWREISSFFSYIIQVRQKGSHQSCVLLPLLIGSIVLSLHTSTNPDILPLLSHWKKGVKISRFFRCTET